MAMIVFNRTGAYAIAVLANVLGVVLIAPSARSEQQTSSPAASANAAATMSDPGAAPASAPRPAQIEPIVEPVKRVAPKMPDNKAKPSRTAVFKATAKKPVPRSASKDVASKKKP